MVKAKAFKIQTGQTGNEGLIWLTYKTIFTGNILFDIVTEYILSSFAIKRLGK